MLYLKKTFLTVLREEVELLSCLRKAKYQALFLDDYLSTSHLLQKLGQDNIKIKTFFKEMCSSHPKIQKYVGQNNETFLQTKKYSGKGVTEQTKIITKQATVNVKKN